MTGAASGRWSAEHEGGKRDAPRWIRMLRRYGYVEPIDTEFKAA